MVQEMCTLQVQEASTQREMATEESGMTKLVDRVLDLILKKLKDLNQPIPINDTMIKLKTKLLFLPVKGELQLDNGKLWGIDTITRPDDVDFEYKDPVADLKSEFMLANLKFSFDFKFVINKRIYKGNITGNITQLDLCFGLKMNFAENELEISEIELKNIKKLKVDVVSSEFAGKLMNIVLCIVTATARLVILCVAENGLQRFLGHKLPI